MEWLMYSLSGERKIGTEYPECPGFGEVAFWSLTPLGSKGELAIPPHQENEE